MAGDAEERAPRRLRLDLVAAGALLEQAGLILAGEGNLSVRAGRAGFLITPRGRDKGRLEPADLVVVRWWPAAMPQEASSETRIHDAVYRLRSEVEAVVHAHPPSVQALSHRGRVPDCSLLTEGSLLLGTVAWVATLPPGSGELAEAAAHALARAPACVLAQHGAVTVGGTVDQATRRMLLLERLAALTLATLESGRA
ncbi:MAG TPA: class II aldolase/adducin family protein [Thermoanaerobaculales bacterium]|nr:class II aldolase/adducin family protein [Thermoanaerobaculales bacterium]HPA80090.1 class II aldolase/adducin family protein [Thermoanaerobaculales bacterium]HQL29630.1 class II aldolase/adducin family protein [Thermoanaerobaculales bacterium]HQN95578.1 class II aldolase/adducin family protein [Thermoanaerobaculales bacterium]